MNTKTIRRTGALAGALMLCTSALFAQPKMMPKGQMDKMGDMKAKNAQMLIQTLSEEKTEINNLTAQKAAFMKMGGAENMKIAKMWTRWIAEHKAGGPMFVSLIKANGGNPMSAKILKPPALGSKEKMLMATHKDHVAAVESSKKRAAMTNDPKVKMAMQKRVALASKHLKEMAPLHPMAMGGMKMDHSKMGHMGKM